MGVNVGPSLVEKSGSAGGQRRVSPGLAAVSYVLLLAAVAAAAGSYYDESASRCGSLLVSSSGPDCSPYRMDRLWLVVATAGLGLVMFAVALFPWKKRLLRSVRPAVFTVTTGLLAPGVEAALIVSLRRVWGPVSEEYTGMPDVWAPVALVAGVLAVCLVANATGLRLGWSMAVAAVAAPVVTLIQTLALDLAGPTHGVTESARLPLVYPVGQEHPLTLALSGVAVAMLLAIARVSQDRVPAPPVAVTLGLFAGTSALVVALLVIDASPDVFAFAPLGHWVWAPLLAASALVAAAVLSRATMRSGRSS
jgi:hypothetical protein